MADRKKDRHKYKQTSIRFSPSYKQLLQRLTEIEQARPTEIMCKALKLYAQSKDINLTEILTDGN